jgi:hypothetical protein
LKQDQHHCNKHHRSRTSNTGLKRHTKDKTIATRTARTANKEISVPNPEALTSKIDNGKIGDPTTRMTSEDEPRTGTTTNASTRTTTRVIFVANHAMVNGETITTTATMVDKARMASETSDRGANPVIAMMAGAANLVTGIATTLTDAIITTAAIMEIVLTTLLSDNDTTTEDTTGTTDTTTQDNRTQTTDGQRHSSNHPTTTNPTHQRPLRTTLSLP